MSTFDHAYLYHPDATPEWREQVHHTVDLLVEQEELEVVGVTTITEQDDTGLARIVGYLVVTTTGLLEFDNAGMCFHVRSIHPVTRS